MAEKPQKKVTKACNTCRLKRKKCNGLHPCVFCNENKIECQYSSEPKRRGPPSGYLRYIETRVALFEVLLGLFISRTGSRSTATDPFFDVAQALIYESKHCTQDVWDGHKRVWMTCRSANVMDELVLAFAPFSQRSEQDFAPKPLLPLVDPEESSRSTESSRVTPPSRALDSALSQPAVTGLTLASSPVPSASVAHSASATGSFSRESNKRSDGHSVHPVMTNSPPSWAYPPPPPQGKKTRSNSTTVEIEIGPIVTLPAGGGSPNRFWPTINMATESDRPQLPPPHILLKMVDVYYNIVWPTFPLLPTRPTLEALLSAIPVHSDAFITVLVALCAYCAHLSPSLEDSTEPDMGTPDIWYQQARSSVQACLKKGSSVEVAQALLLLAMRDHGQGNDSQAWFLSGLAIRVGQDVDLNGDLPSTSAKKYLPPPEIRLRKNIWRVSLMLDLFLSLQLGRSPASFEGLRSPPNYDIQPTEYATHPVPIFLHTVTLCRTISRIYLHLYLGCDTPNLQTPTQKLGTLREELEMWHRTLPAHYRVAAGNLTERRDVLELNMLYHVAVIILHHPYYREGTTPDAMIEAAAAFNELLKRSQDQALSSSSQTLTNPNMIYYIITAAFAHLSGHKMLCMYPGPQRTAITTSETMRCQIRLHLSHCLEALASQGRAWGLAKRLWEALDRLMEIEGLKPEDFAPTTSGPVKSRLGKRPWEEVNGISEVERGPLSSGPHSPTISLATSWGVNKAFDPMIAPGSTSHSGSFNVTAFPSTGWLSEA